MKRGSDTGMRELSASEINWELRPVPEPTMSAIDQTVEAVIDGLSYRLCFVEALEHLHALTKIVDRLREMNQNLGRELEAAHRECGKLRLSHLETEERS